MVNKLGIIVQAHIGSSRLHEKMMLDLYGKSVLGHVISRIKNVRNADAIIVATSDDVEDNVIVDECKKYQVDCFRGSNADVLSRFYYAAKAFHLTDIARVCADNTLIDWTLIEKEINDYNTKEHKIVNCATNIPLGLGCEIFSFKMLEEAFHNGKQHYHREHVTPYIYEKYGEPYRTNLYKGDYSKYRFTLDTKEDWDLIQKIYGFLYKGSDDVRLDRVFELMEKHPELYEINKNVKQKSAKD